jgi:hypothetical protein
MPILCQTVALASSGPAHYSSVMALRSTFLRLHRCLRQLGRPPRDFTSKWRPPCGVRAWRPCQVLLGAWALYTWDLPGRHASSGPARLLQLCKISGCLYTSYVQDQHYFVSFIVDNLFMRHTFQDPAAYPRILDIVDLRPLRGRHAYKASSRSALPDSLQLC